MLTDTSHTSASPVHRDIALDQRLETLFWGLLFILVGSIWLIPDAQVPEGTWLIGIGLVLLVPNVVRYFSSIAVRVLPSVLGVFALVAGLLAFFGVEIPLISLTLIVIGAGIILKLLLTGRLYRNSTRTADPRRLQQ
jgi:hypothetical protein